MKKIILRGREPTYRFFIDWDKKTILNQNAYTRGSPPGLSGQPPGLCYLST